MDLSDVLKSNQSNFLSCKNASEVNFMEALGGSFILINLPRPSQLTLYCSLNLRHHISLLG